MTFNRINSLPLLFPHSSFLRRQESSEQAFLIRCFVAYWIPACAGMANGDAVHSVISVSSVA